VPRTCARCGQCHGQQGHDHGPAQPVTDVPMDRLENERSTKIVELESNIKQKLYGQDAAVDRVLERVYINFSGIGNAKRPMASFLFLGPTGTGKTELAKLLGRKSWT
jgi:ATP-dependent Clp protease ATP-binding subunit ClpC